MSKIKTFRKTPKATLAGIDISHHISSQKLLILKQRKTHRSEMMKIMEREKEAMLKELAI